MQSSVAEVKQEASTREISTLKNKNGFGTGTTGWMFIVHTRRGRSIPINSTISQIKLHLHVHHRFLMNGTEKVKIQVYVYDVVNHDLTKKQLY